MITATTAWVTALLICNTWFMEKTSVLDLCFVIKVHLAAIKQYQCYIFWSIKIWAPIFVRPKAVTDLKNGLYSPLIVYHIGNINTYFLAQYHE